MRIGLLVLVGVLIATLTGSATAAESAFRRVVVTRGLEAPVQVTAPRNERRRLYVVEQRGTIRVIDRGKLRDGFFLDIRQRTTAGGEQGFLGLAFDPKYATNRFIYVNYTDMSGDTRIVRYKTNGRQAIPSSARELLLSISRTRTTTAVASRSARTGSSTSGPATADREATRRIVRRTYGACSGRCFGSM